MMNILRGAHVVKFIVASGLALVVGLGTTKLGVAEDGKGVGRTADGRAYRVDNQGNEIVDYIAELELQQDALNRRIYGLEAEIAEKNQVIERMSQGGNVAEVKVAEKTIAGGETSSCSDLKRELQIARDETNRVREQAQQGVSLARESCEVELSEREQSFAAQIAELRQKEGARGQGQSVTRATNSAGAAGCPEVRCSITEKSVATAVDCRPVENELTTREVELSAALRDLKKLRVEFSEAQQARAGWLTEVANLKAAHQEQVTGLERLAREKEAALERATREFEQRLNEAKTQLVKLESERHDVRARMVDAPQQVTVSSATIVRGNNSNARQAVVESLRGSLLSEFNKVKSLVADRDRRFGAGRTKIDSSLQVRASALISSRGRSLAWVGSAIRAARSVHELADVRSDLSEIRARAQEDLSFMNRMGGKR